MAALEVKEMEVDGGRNVRACARRGRERVSSLQDCSCFYLSDFLVVVYAVTGARLP